MVSSFYPCTLRNEVTPRLLGKFHMIWLTALSDASMTRIFDAILGGFLAHELPSLTSVSLPLGACVGKLL
jgi:hypothetical protein